MSPFKTLHKTLLRSALGAALLGLALHAQPAAAQDLPLGVLKSKNVVERTVVIDDQTFRVTDRTEILDLAGRPMRFEALSTAAEQGPLVELDRVTYAYDANGDVLALLQAASVPR